ncbi:hypothetical protein K2Y00_03820 [Patescibacteria group bacterium]|nr:hypothetical protein [Patescibacteria group bacterium]
MSEDLKQSGEALPKELQNLITTYEGASEDRWIEWSKEWDLETTRLIRNTAVAVLQLGEESRKAKRKEGIDLHNDGSPESALTAPLFFISEAALKRIESGLNQVIT